MRAQLRRAGVADAPAIAAITVRAWQGAYRGLISDAILDGLSVERRTAEWQRLLTSGSALERTFGRSRKPYAS